MGWHDFTRFLLMIKRFCKSPFLLKYFPEQFIFPWLLISVNAKPIPKKSKSHLIPLISSDLSLFWVPLQRFRRFPFLKFSRVTLIILISEDKCYDQRWVRSLCSRNEFWVPFIGHSSPVRRWCLLQLAQEIRLCGFFCPDEKADM